MTSTIGFAGLGTMGLPMAVNLAAVGYTVLGVDPVPAAMRAAQTAGIKTVESLAELGGSCDEIVTMLPTGGHLLDAVLGDGGLAATLRSGALLIDCSTVEVHAATETATALEGAGIAFVDAPVSGGVGGARAGTLTFMVGGADAAVARARPLLDVMGGKVVHAGPVGSGQAAKVCNNLMFAAALSGAAEAFVLADRLGLRAEVLYDIVSHASGNSWALQNFCPWPGVVEGSAADEGYAPRFAARLMRKDLGLAVAAAEATDLDLGLLAAVRDLFERTVREDGDLDASSVVRQVDTRTREGLD